MKNYLLGTTALLLAACGGSGDTASERADTASPNATPPTAAEMLPAEAGNTAIEAQDYVARAGAGDMWEIESSRALLAKSTNEEVKKFAQMMIDQHGQSTAKIKAAAQSAGVAIATPKLNANQQRMLDEIKQADAPSIDAIYLRHQRSAHADALALHQAYAAGGDIAGLKPAATEIARVVEMHRRELEKLDGSRQSSAKAP